MADQQQSIEQRFDTYRRFFDLSGKTAVMLGAASGIGKASAEAFAALGDRGHLGLTQTHRK